jgi:hypothetical protein
MFAWVLRDHAMITSGAYKFSTAQQGYKDEKGELAFRDQTDEEKLKSAMGTLNAHCDWVRQCVDALGEELSEETKRG